MEQKVKSPLRTFKDKESGKWGFKNNDNEVVVVPQWWLICHRFDDGRCAVVNDDKKIGFVDETGQLVIPCKYVSHSYFSEGLCKVEEDVTFMIGYINTKGETIIPFKYLRGGNFENGMAFVMGTNEKWGAINTKGETVIPFEFGYIIGFHEGLSAFIGDNHLYGFIDKSGNQVIPPIWDFCSGFENGLAPVRKFRKKVWLYRQTRKCGYSLSVGWC
ncbi:MAG: WG repeat-containing protein [Prevotella sp.]|nr:WG repeat-containing protein [Prevotella sp.]